MWCMLANTLRLLQIVGRRAHTHTSFMTLHSLTKPPNCLQLDFMPTWMATTMAQAIGKAIPSLLQGARHNAQVQTDGGAGNHHDKAMNIWNHHGWIASCIESDTKAFKHSSGIEQGYT